MPEFVGVFPFKGENPKRAKPSHRPAISGRLLVFALEGENQFEKNGLGMPSIRRFLAAKYFILRTNLTLNSLRQFQSHLLYWLHVQE